MIYTDSIAENELIAALSDAEKTVFLRTVLYMSKLDGQVDEDEVNFIKKVVKKFKIANPQDIFATKTEDEIIEDLAVISERRTALELIKELCMLGHADNDLSDEEVLFIGHVGKALDISIKKIEEISNWVIDYVIWLEQGKIIFEDGEND